jgi:hypothetical protein
VLAAVRGEVAEELIDRVVASGGVAFGNLADCSVTDGEGGVPGDQDGVRSHREARLGVDDLEIGDVAEDFGEQALALAGHMSNHHEADARVRR